MKVLVVVSNPNEACSFYRAVGPWSAMARENQRVTRRLGGQEIQVLYSKNPMWADIRQVDVVFMQRAASKDYLKIALTAKDFDVPVWVDYDDDLLNIPRDNPNYQEYQKYRETIQDILKLADKVTVTTSNLAKSMSKFSKSIEVIPNALDDSLLRLKSTEKRNRFVLWRGSSTHAMDVGTVAKEIVSIANAYQDYYFAFLGADPCAWQVSEKIVKTVRITDQMDPLPFFRTMITLNPEVLIAPLHDCEFNRSKSNIAAIEGALAGAAILAPDWEQWRLPGVVRYKGADEFKECLSQMLSGQINTRLKAEETWNYVSTELLLSGVNGKRFEILKELTLQNSKDEFPGSVVGARTSDLGARI